MGKPQPPTHLSLYIQGVHLSGIMAILFCGVVMSHYTHYNLSPVTQVTKLTDRGSHKTYERAGGNDFLLNGGKMKLMNS